MPSDKKYYKPVSKTNDIATSDIQSLLTNGFKAQVFHAGSGKPKRIVFTKNSVEVIYDSVTYTVYALIKIARMLSPKIKHRVGRPTWWEV